MAGIASEECGVGRSTDVISSGQRCQSGEALAEWRSSEQVENGTPSTSPPYWDSDDSDDTGAKPSELYGKYTWRIEKFSQINKRELRSNAFEVGGYKWYILIYPQGCDVCNHLSLFLCVANHDKLLPGWSHFAQFTIAVVNKDPKKSKYSDTLHRFWKKEHDWGWKKFMELSKVLDGFIDGDTLIIKAQVQVIRERADRPFRCLDCQYRRELVRVYLTNVEQICRRFVEERRGKLGKLIEDKARWSSFCAFWLGIEQNARRRMSREKMDSILKVVVKHFFIEKEVTSTLVMDSLYSGLKALEGQTKSKNGRAKLLDAVEMPAPIICVEEDMFVLVDDVLLLLERAALEPLPPKDEKGPQNRTKDGGPGEDFNKDSIERDERRLTELGRRTVEIFVLAHIFSNKIEVSYQEAVALKRQEELIREEEAAWLAESEQKAKRGAIEKEKKAKKKQAKQKRNNRKGKDKGKDERAGVTLPEKQHEGSRNDDRKDIREQVQTVLEKLDTLGDVSDVSDSVECAAEMPQPDSEDRDASNINWDTDTSEVHPPAEASSSANSDLSSVQNGITGRKSPGVMDDSSSTCSTDSIPSVVMNGPYKGNSFPNYKNQKSASRGKNQRSKAVCDGTSWANESDAHPSGPATDAGDLNDASGSCKTGESESEASSLLHDRIKWPEQRVVRKEEEAVLLQKKLSIKDQVDMERQSKEKTTAAPSSPRSPPRSLPSTALSKSELKSTPVAEPVSVRKASSNSPQAAYKAAPLVNSAQTMIVSKPEIQKAASPKPTEQPTLHQVPLVSRPSTAPLIPGPRPTASVASIAQTAPLLSRSVSSAGRLGPDPSPATHSYVPQSYRNAIIGNSVASSSSGITHPHSSTSTVNSSSAYSQLPSLVSSPMFLPQNCDRMDANSVKPGFSFGMGTQDILPNGAQWTERAQRDVNRSPSMINDTQSLDFYNAVHSGSRDHFSTEFPAGTSGYQSHGVMTDEFPFPHLDIINDLLNDEQVGKAAVRVSSSSQSLSNGPHYLSRQRSFPGDMGMAGDLGSSTSSACRFERTRSYHVGANHEEVFQRSYGSSPGSHFDLPLPLREFIPQANPAHYSNGQQQQQMDGVLIQNQWQDIPLFNAGNAVESDGGYPSYYIPDYSNPACGIDGYTMFRPSNGH